MIRIVSYLFILRNIVYVFSNFKQDDSVTDNSLEEMPISDQEESNEEPYDYSQDWSDYDSWGYDGIMEKRTDNQKKRLVSPSISSPSKLLYEQRHRRRLGSMKRSEGGKKK